MDPQRVDKRKGGSYPSLPAAARDLRALLISGSGVLSVDGLDALVRTLAVTAVVALSLLGYGHATGEGRVLEPLVVAVALVAYNALVVALGVPWRHRPGFYLFLLDWGIASLSIALTGWLFSPFIVLLYACVIGAALRLGVSRFTFILAGCALLFLMVGGIIPDPSEALKLPVLVVESTSLLMVALTAAVLRRAVEVEIRRVELEEQSAAQFRLLNELINSLLAGTPDLHRMTREVASAATTALRADAALVVLYDLDGTADAQNVQQLRHAPLYLAADQDPGPVSLSTREREFIEQMLSGARPVTIELHHGDVDFPALSRKGVDSQAVLGVPVMLDAHAGALLVGRREQRRFTEAEANLLAAMGQQMAVAVRLARVYALEHDRALQSAERERLERDLLSIVSHELRTPLTAIKMSVSALGRNNRDDGEERLVRNIERNADRLAALVDDLLDMARLRSGRVKLDLRSVNLGELIGDLAAQVWPMLESKDQALQVDLPALGSVRWHSLAVRADKRRIEQVLLNLIANAYKYAPAGSTVTIGATPRGEVVRLFVRDEGPGVPAQERRRIFDKFYSAESEASVSSQSVGLGLAIARSLVHLHGGEIGVHGRVGGGSTFFFTLPIRAHAESTHSATGSPRADQAKS